MSSFTVLISDGRTTSYVNYHFARNLCFLVYKVSTVYVHVRLTTGLACSQRRNLKTSVAALQTHFSTVCTGSQTPTWRPTVWSPQFVAVYIARYSSTGLDRPLEFQEVETPIISGQSASEGCQP